jgi:peptidoglycan hydrolase-like protein with peptidoglycan-binding domain
MQPLKIGSNNADVRTLQIELNKLGYGLATDGIYGAKTAAAVTDFTANEFGKSNATNEVSQSLFDLIKSRANPQKFVVVLDAGHGGIDPKTGLYTTPASNGKRYHHPNAKLHDNGWFFEGVENRIIANVLAEKLTAAGVQVVKAYH